MHSELHLGALRLLRWLDAYPFQRGQDLVVALAPWHGRTSVYQYLALLEERHFLETLPTGRFGTLYHVSPAGTRFCAASFADDPWESQEVASRLREARERLVRLVPRLPVFFVLQDLVNGLVTHASTALTTEGRRTQLVLWSWQRDLRHAFVFREQPFRLHMDGALTLRFQFAAQAPQQPATLAPAWYTLFLLHGPVDDVALFRSHLDRFLRWRESSERTATYSQLPLLLVLATSARQAEWWQEASEQAVSRLQVAAPLGAVCVTAADSATRANGWRLPWRTLGGNASVHLQDLLRPLRAPVVSHPFGWPTVAASAPVSMQGTWWRSIRCHSYRLHPTVSGTPAPYEKTRKRPCPDACLLSAQLRERQQEVLFLCLAHPLLSRADLEKLLGLQRTTINQLLAEVRVMGLLEPTETATGERWTLTEQGLRLAAQQMGCSLHHLVNASEEMPLEQRGVAGLLHQIHHTSGVYAFCADLTQVLASTPDAQVCWWETGQATERHFRWHDHTYRFRPDAVVQVKQAGQRLCFWLEWDRGTMLTRDLQQKMAIYALYLGSREWAQTFPRPPALLCVVPDMAQERRLASLANARLVQVPKAFEMYTTTAGLLAMQGVLASIWRPTLQQHEEAVPANPRQALFRSGAVSER